jgi:sensor domain CHASE-containing protein
MKYILLLLIPTLVISKSKCASKQNRYEDEPNIKQVEPNTKPKVNKELEAELNRIKILRARSDSFLLSEANKVALLKQANQSNEAKLRETAKARELIIAEKWQDSMTGKIDGRSWFELGDYEKREYRAKFYSSYKTFDN